MPVARNGLGEPQNPQARSPVGQEPQYNEGNSRPRVANWSQGVPSRNFPVLLRSGHRCLAPEFGHNPTDADYFLTFRNPVFSYMTAERLLIIYSEKGSDGIRQELKKVQARGVI